MIFKVTDKILDKIKAELPYLRYNETNFVYMEEQYLSKNGKVEAPWKNPKEAIIHRVSAEFPKNEAMDFEKDFNSFKDYCRLFFDESQAKTLSNLKHFLFIGDKDHLNATEVANWSVVADLLDKTDLDEYLSFGRYLIRIPCGEWNINIIKLANGSDLYLEITAVWINEESDVEKLHQILSLTNPLDLSWAEIAINHLDE